MVRFQARWINKTYKGKDRRYRICAVNFPVKLHDRVEAKANSKNDYNVEWDEHETDELEIVTVTFTRKKQSKDPPTTSGNRNS
jgi:hypothetical protein